MDKGAGMNWNGIKNFFVIVAACISGVVAALAISALAIFLTVAPFIIVIAALVYAVKVML